MFGIYYLVSNHTLPSDILHNCSGAMFCLGKWAYVATGGLFWTGMLLAFCFALFMASFKLGTGRAFGFAAVAGLFLSIMMAISQFIPWWVATLFIIVGVIATAILILTRDS